MVVKAIVAGSPLLRARHNSVVGKGHYDFMFSVLYECMHSRVLVDDNIIHEEEKLACVSAAPEIPKEPMEFLARAWSLAPLELSKALPPLTPHSKENVSTLACMGIVIFCNEFFHFRIGAHFPAGFGSHSITVCKF